MAFYFELSLRGNAGLENIYGRVQSLGAAHQQFRPFDVFDLYRFTPSSLHYASLVRKVGVDIATADLRTPLAPFPQQAQRVQGYLDLSDSLREKGFFAVQPIVFAEQPHQGTPLMIATPLYDGSGKLGLAPLDSAQKPTSTITPDQVFPIGRVRWGIGSDLATFIRATHPFIEGQCAKANTLASWRVPQGAQCNALMHVSDFTDDGIFVISGQFNK